MFKDNKYTKTYNRLIANAVTRQWKKQRGRERHHIIPQSLGGPNTKENLVYLSCREHAICHWLLVKMTEGEAYNKMVYAFNGMNATNDLQDRYYSPIISRAYERNRIEQARIHSITMKGKLAWNKGVPQSEEHKEKNRQAALKRGPKSLESIEKWKESRAGYKHSEETKLKQSLALTGKPKGPMSKEEKLKRSITMKGKAKPEGFGDKVAERMKQSFTENNPNKREDLKKICPHCGTKSGPSGYSRWHGDNCKKQGI